MFGKSKIALSLAFVLGAASFALADDMHGQGPHEGGGPVQTWCDIDPACNGWNKRHSTPYASSAPGFAAAPSQKHRPSHKHGKDAHDR
jgi:hypothetical protein